MRKLALGLALASTALASPSMARDGQWYVGVDGGVMILEDSSYDIGTTANAANISHEKGYDFGGVVGYDFGGFRLESEVSYKEADPSSMNSSVRIPGPAPISSAAPGVTGTWPYVAGDANALSFMVNGMFDFGADDGIQGFAGAGIGVARVDNHYSINRLGPGWVNDSDTGLAWQAIAGIRAPISDSWDVGLKYRFFNVKDVDLVDTAGRAVNTNFRSHSLMGSLVYNFGGEEAPPIVEPPMVAPPPPVYVAPPPPPRVAPPPPPRVVCNTGHIVFFDWDKSNLLPAATSVLDNAASQYANCGNARVMLAGHADKSGSNQYNVGLSQRRNTAVRGYLETKGIAGGAISTEAFGETAPLVQTADGVREPQNRRVEVTYGPGSGN